MPQQPISNVKAMSVLHFSLLIGQVMFAIIAFYLLYSKTFQPVFDGADNNWAVVAGVAAFSFALSSLAFIGFKKNVERIRQSSDTLEEKLAAYRAKAIIRWAMLEFPTLLTIICFVLTGNKMLLIVVALLLLVFYSTRVTPQIVANHLEISVEEVL